MAAIDRDKPEADEKRAALVQRLTGEVQAAKRHWKRDFDRMRRNMRMASGVQWPAQAEDDDRYVANLVQRVLKTTVSSLYARNPTAVAQRRQTLDFAIWDGKPESAMAALQTVQAAAAFEAAGGVPMVDPMTGAPMPPPNPAELPAAMALLVDIQQGVARQKLLDDLGRTLVCCLDYYIDESRPTFKGQLKRVVRRVRTCGVGYVKLGFKRQMELSEEQDKGLNEMAEQLAAIKRLAADLADGETDMNSAEAEELHLAMTAMQQNPDAIVYEGLAWSFPQSTRIIPSIGTESLTEWVGAEWVAEEVMLTSARIKEVYGKDVGAGFTSYRLAKGAPESGAYRQGTARDGQQSLACVWHIHDRRVGLEYVVCEGYADFLKEPAAPPIHIEQFYPWFAVTFNDVEDEERLFPMSDVELMKHIQREYNRKAEALRQHRIAARPMYLSPAGVFDEAEKKSLAEHKAHDVIEIGALEKGMKAADIVMPMAKIGVDPNLYLQSDSFNDLQRVTGQQEAVLGGLGKGTATESNIAEGSRQGTLGFDGDNLDDMLSLLFRAASQVMLSELSEQTVREIAGIGAVWPEMSRQQVMREVWLQVRGGSSGRPNQAREAANFEKVAPILLQTPGVKPSYVAERAIRIIDDGTSLDDAYVDGLPSVLTMNAQAQSQAQLQVAPGDATKNPTAQGPEGANKTPTPKPAPGGDQNSFPAAG